MMEKRALFDEDRVHRFLLWRNWEPLLPQMMVIGLNPSTADEELDDPTIRRCIGFARDLGYGGLIMANVFPYRSTDPKKLPPAVEQPMKANQNYILEAAAGLSTHGGIIVAAWGTGPVWRRWHGRQLAKLIRFRGILLHCFRRTKAGDPAHPLYLPKSLRPELY